MAAEATVGTVDDKEVEKVVVYLSWQGLMCFMLKLVMAVVAQSADERS